MTPSLTTPRLLAAALVTIALATPALAQGPAATVDAFYDAVRSGDAEALQSVLADDAVIRLADLGFDMTKEEFVESMDTWVEVAADMTMRVKPDPATPDTEETAVRLVCYDFPSNQSLTRETSTVVNGKITANMQEEIAESCEGF